MYSSETETLEQLKIGHLQFVQPKRGYRFSLDAILLADFISAKPKERLIDLGTGSGIIPLLVSVLTPVREIIGFELQERLMRFACRNVALNALNDRIRIVQGNLKEIDAYFRAGEFDLLCSNPPYRKLGDGRLNPGSEQAIARHEVECELEDVLSAAKFLLRPGGKMFIIYLPERLVELLAGLQRYRLEAKRIRCIHSAKKTPASLVLVEAQRDASAGLAVLPPLFLYCRENVYSSEARKFCMKGERIMKEQWTELSVIVSQVVADLVSDKLIEYGSQGTVFEDVPETAGLCKIIAYYPDSSDIEHIREQLQHYLDELQQLGESVEASEIHAAVITNPGWASSWKEFFKPTRVGERIVIKPSWEIFDAQPSDIVIELDPGMAFGTGLHASTRLAIELLEQYLRADNSVLNVGVGSGILSLVAARLGAESVLGVDVDAEAVDIARENVRKNCQLYAAHSTLEHCIELEVGSIDTLDISRQFDCILMNIRPNIIVTLLPYAATYLQTGGALIVSGILEEEGPDLLHEIRAFNFISHQQLTEDGWIAYVLSQV